MATAIVAYLWNENQIELSIEGHDDFNHSNISLSYHIILKGLNIFDVIIEASEKISYIVHLSSSEIEHRGLKGIQRCTHLVPNDLNFIVSEDTCFIAEDCSISVSSKTSSDDSAVSLLDKEENIVESTIFTPSSMYSQYIQLDGSWSIDDTNDLVALCSGSFPAAVLPKVPLGLANLTQDYAAPLYFPQITVSSHPFLGQDLGELVAPSCM